MEANYSLGQIGACLQYWLLNKYVTRNAGFGCSQACAYVTDWLLDLTSSASSSRPSRHGKQNKPHRRPAYASHPTPHLVARVGVFELCKPIALATHHPGRQHLPIFLQLLVKLSTRHKHRQVPYENCCQGIRTALLPT